MKEKKERSAARCKHCGGMMRLYRDGVNCIMCGRGMNHFCIDCMCLEEGEAQQKKVA